MLLASMLFSACATQTYEASPIAPTQIAEQWRAQNLHDPQLLSYINTSATPAPIQIWGLPELTLAAFYFNPDLNVVKSQWLATQAAEITAGQKPNPKISASSEHHGKATGISPWTLTLGVEIPIETHGKREARTQQSTAMTEAAQLEIAQAAWRIRSQIRARLLDIYAIRQQTAQIAHEVNLHTQIVQLLQARLDKGLASATELSEAALHLRKARTQMKTEWARMADARIQLASVMGLPESALANIPLAFTAFEQDTNTLPADAVQRAALLNRLELRRALARYDAAEARLKLEIAKQYPDFNLGPGYSWDQGDNRWSLGLSLVLALLNKNEGPIAEAKAQRDVVAQQFNALQTSILSEQEQALTRWQAAQEAIPQAQTLLKAQLDRLEQTRQQFDAGLADRLELTNAQLELVAAEARILAAKHHAQQVLGQLEDAVQQPLDGSAALPEMPREKSQ